MGFGWGDVEQHGVDEGDQGWALDGANGLLILFSSVARPEIAAN